VEIAARLARNVASSLPRRPHTITENFEQKVSAVERRDGVAGFGAYIRRSGGAPPGVRRRKAGTDQGTTVV